MIKCNGLIFLGLMSCLIGCANKLLHEMPTQSSIAKTPQPHLVPDSVYNQISIAIESGANKSGQLKQIETALCIGDKPRVAIRRMFTYTSPSTQGLPLDEASSWKVTHLQGAEKFLKNEYFFYAGQSFRGSSQPDDINQPLGEDELDVIDRKAYEHRNFVNNKELLQETYAARFLKTLYYQEGGYADMQFLFQNFTFRVPYDVIVKFEEIDQTPFIKLPADSHYFGYDRSMFSPRLALDHQDFLWRWIARNSTSISRAATESGAARFMVEMKFDLFCKYSVAANELKSR